jgi:hypothetical protein
VNINPLIPKLNTPYEKEISYFLKDNLDKLRLKYQFLEKGLKSLRSIKIKFQDYKAIIKNARLQTMISLGDEDIYELLLSYYQHGANFGGLKRAENDLDFSFEEYLIKIRDCYSPWHL